MPNKYPLVKLSREEEFFLRHWVYDEVHYQTGQGPAKRLQIEHRAIPSDLGTLIAAVWPDPAEQEAAALGPPPAEPPKWPWSDETLWARICEARSALAARVLDSAPRSDTQPDR
jgi:hypothetical protein